MARRNRVRDFQAAYLRAHTTLCGLNREVQERLDALHAALTRRDAYMQKYEKARREVDRALRMTKAKAPR